MTVDANTAGDTNTPAGDNANANGDQKPDATGKPAAEAAPAAGEKPAEGDKSEVDYTFEMPDGIEVDAASADEFKAIAKELGLSKEGAQKIVALEAKRVQAQVEAHQKLLTDWTAASKADKEFGGDKFDENLAVAKTALDTFGSPELKEMLASSGMGSHPEVVRLMHRIGKAISEDKFVKPGATTGATKSAAETLYG